MNTLEKKLAAMDFDEAADEVVISGANLRIVNGLGHTDTTNGLGNLIVGYNEGRSPEELAPFSLHPLNPDARSGSHNVVVGRGLNFVSVGGLVSGYLNESGAEFASVTGGARNTASAPWAAISGGSGHLADGFAASITGGIRHTASGDHSAISGGANHTAVGQLAVVSGGSGNSARGAESVVSGGRGRTAPRQFDWVAGPLFADE